MSAYRNPLVFSDANPAQKVAAVGNVHQENIVAGNKEGINADSVVLLPTQSDNTSKATSDQQRYTSSSDSSSGNDSDNSDSPGAASSSRKSSTCYYYYAPFTMFSKFYAIRPDNSIHYQELIAKEMRCRSNLSNQSNWTNIIATWNKSAPSKKKVPLTTVEDDLHIGDDGLLSQSTFLEGLLTDDRHLNSLCPTLIILPRIFIQNKALPFYVHILCQAVLHLRSIQTKGESLSIMMKKGGKKSINIFRIPASECSIGLNDGAEFFQWTYCNDQAQLWFCPSIRNSPFLVKAIQSAMKMSPMAMQVFSFERLKEDTQFLGYVTAQTEENFVNHLHIHSFVLFHTQNNTTNVICMMTSRIHIMHPMQERLLQLVQLLQYKRTAPTFDLILTNKVLYCYSEGNVANLKLKEFSRKAFECYGFSLKKNTQETQEENPDLFTLCITEFIKIVEHGDAYNWGIYAKRILQSYRPNDRTKWSLPPLDNGLVKSFKQIFKQFLSRDPGGCLSYGFDKDTYGMIEKCVSDVTYRFVNDEQHCKKSLIEKFDMALEDVKAKISERLFNIAVNSTKIPLSLFTELFHQAFKKHKFLQSSFELLQQFEIQLSEYSSDYLIFPGDLHKWHVTCLRCKKKITKPGALNVLLTLVPIAIFHHLSLTFADTDSYYIPVLFSSHERFKHMQKRFYERKYDQVCERCRQIRIDILNKDKTPQVAPILNLCEAIKMDLHFSSTKPITQLDQMVLNTRSMMEVVFFSHITVDTAVYRDWFQFTPEELTVEEELAEDIVYWNRLPSTKKKKNRGEISFLRKDIIPENPQGLEVDEMAPEDIESLALCEAIIAFGQNEMFKNRVRLIESLSIILHRSSLKKSGKMNHEFSDKYTWLLNMTDRDVKRFMKSRYEQHLQREGGTIQHGLHKTLLREHEVCTLGLCNSHRPMQYALGTLPTMSSILSTVDKGWKDVNKLLYFRDTGTVRKKEDTGTVSDDQEETLILLRTMKAICMCVKKRNPDNTIQERRFEIKCNVEKYEPKNATLRNRHPAIFRNEEYIFVPSNDMVLSMPFSWVDKLTDNKWTLLEKSWKKKTHDTLQRAKSQSIVSISLYSRKFADYDNISEQSMQPTSRHIFQISLDKSPNQFFFVTLEQIYDMLGDQPWMKGDINSLANVGSGRTVFLSWGARKKTDNNYNEFLSVGAIVDVRNHGSKGACYSAAILEIQDKTAEVKWTSTGRREIVQLSDCYIMDHTTHYRRKRQKTDRFEPETKNRPDRKSAVSEPTMLPGQVPNKYHCCDNLTKKCAEGAIANLLNMLGFHEDEINLFWNLSRDTVGNISLLFCETIPKKVIKSGSVDSIERSLWILRNKFGFNTTGPLKKERLRGITRTFEFLKQVKFPTLIAVKSDQAAYEHVVVVWNKRIIDYETMYTMPLTSETISELCGSTTKFSQISCGYGLIPPKTHRPLTDHNDCVIEWGLTELYHGNNDGVRGYFK